MSKVESDTLNLLGECDSGTKMAVAAIDEVLSKTDSEELKELLNKNRSEHETLGDELKKILEKMDSEGQKPNAMAKSMSWMKTNMKLAVNESDNTVADLITEGCNMGIKSLHRYLNQYSSADEVAKNMCRKIIDIEESLRKGLEKFL